MTRYKSMKYLITTLVLTMMSSVPACAQMTVDSTMTRPWSVTPWSSVGRMLIVLALVVVLIWLALHLLKRAMGLKGSAVGGIELFGGVSLGPRKSLQFVRVGNSLHLLGATDHHIGLIATIDDPAEVEQILAGTSTSPPDAFANLLKKFTGGKANPAIDRTNSSGA